MRARRPQPKRVPDLGGLPPVIAAVLRSGPRRTSSRGSLTHNGTLGPRTPGALAPRTRVLAAIGLIMAGACEGPSAPAAPVASRVDSIQRAEPTADPVEAFCDVKHAPGKGAALTLPPVEGSAVEGNGHRWLNVWATWCKPCVEEIPRVVGFRERLAKAGTPVRLDLLSVDTEAKLIEDFRAAHQGVPASMRLTDASALGPWLDGLGLDPGAGLPIHIFTEPSGAIRCVRAGAVSDHDYDTIASVLGGG